MTSKSSKTYTIEEAAKVALVCHLYMRKLVKSGRVQGSKDSYGRWMIDAESVHAYVSARESKDAARIERIKAGESNHPTRPTVSTYNRMVRVVREDTTLTPEQRTVFLAALERYNAAWEKQYNDRQAAK